MKRLKNRITIILLITATLCLIPIILYFLKFSCKGWATDTSVWGTFGDFIGGTINPIIGLANLIILLLIAYYVARYEDNRQINEFRYRAYADLSQKIAEVNFSTPSKLLNAVNEYLKIFTLNNQFLFTDTRQIFIAVMNNLQKSLEKLIEETESSEDKFASGAIRLVDVPKEVIQGLIDAFGHLTEDNEQTRAYKKFMEERQNALGYIQAIIVNEGVDEYKKMMEEKPIKQSENS